VKLLPRMHTVQYNLIGLKFIQLHAAQRGRGLNDKRLFPLRTRRPASADRTARRHVLPMEVGPFAIRHQGNGATPCQYIDTTWKAIDCATTLPLAVFIWWNFATDFSPFIVEIVPILRKLGAA